MFLIAQATGTPSLWLQTKQARGSLFCVLSRGQT
jgi:hypothetical protein